LPKSILYNYAIVNHNMKKFFTYFFVSLGVIFFSIILVGIYFFITDPLNIRPFIFQQKTDYRPVINSASTPSDSETPATNTNSGLTPNQEKALETFGIDPGIVSSITPEQEMCFTTILGADRVAQIKAGDSPTPGEFLRAQSCI